jgi:hypothetical protein
MKQAKAATRIADVRSPVRAARTRTTARPSSEFQLSSRERAILADTDWVTEDEADVIFCMRQEHEPTIPLDEVAKELGLPLEN